MAKKSMIEREKKRLKLYKKNQYKRVKLLKQYQDSDNFSSKLDLHTKLQKLPRNSSKTRIRNRCWKTGRPRGVLEILVCRAMYLEKWLINAYYLALKN